MSMKKKFLRDDVVVCISNVGGLTIGNSYIINSSYFKVTMHDWGSKSIDPGDDVSGYGYMVRDDNGIISSYDSSVFIDIVTYRNNIINNILE